jgi:hypothetical protein
MTIVKVWCGLVAAFGGFALALGQHLPGFWIAVAVAVWLAHVALAVWLQRRQST